MELSPLDTLIEEAERLEPSFNAHGWPETFRALLAVVKAAKQLAEGDCAVHDPSGNAYLETMNNAAGGKNGH